MVRMSAARSVLAIPLLLKALFPEVVSLRSSLLRITTATTPRANRLAFLPAEPNGAQGVVPLQPLPPPPSPSLHMRLSDLVRHIHITRVEGPLDVEVARVTHDSRNAGRSDLFVAIRGAKVDGRTFVPDLDVAAVIADAPVSARTTVIHVPDARRALAEAAAALAGHPSTRVPVIGVTGTNGKTTVTWMLEAIAHAHGWKVGVIGTTGYRTSGPLGGSVNKKAEHTTPEAPVIQALLREMVHAGAGLVAMEVSSIGLQLRRADGIDFAAAIFTNLSRDHLDFHETMDAYQAAKARLFGELLREGGTAIVYGEDPAHEAMRPPLGRTFWRYGLRPGFEIEASDLRTTLAGTTAAVATPAGKGELRLQLVGSHNVLNALGALGGALAIGIPLEHCLAGLAALATVPGRLERVPNDRGIHVFVDYAHTPDALVHVLRALRTLDARRVITVFGCGGDRDPGKRPLMGAAASAASDLVVVTSDNPRSEDPDAIIRAIVPGVTGAFSVEADRRKAIARAIAEASAGDVVLIAGKGHETTQTVGTAVLPFDDRVVARECLAGAAR
jgi:UDP-N-acetylmuramoyl-L-alanyl-D-glutamate--2,6-diaminopimelate ligase